MTKVIEVVDTSIFKEKIQMAEAILPFVLSLLTTQKSVSRFLEKTPLTISNMVKDNRLEEGVHYVKEDDKIVFIPSAIIDYKMNPPSNNPKPKEAYIPSQEAKDLLA